VFQLTDFYEANLTEKYQVSSCNKIKKCKENIYKVLPRDQHSFEKLQTGRAGALAEYSVSLFFCAVRRKKATMRGSFEVKILIENPKIYTRL
jgi:hypothetical protein